MGGDNMSPVGIGMGVMGIFVFLLYIAFLGLGIFCTALFIKLALKGIKALDIYIDKNNNNGQTHL